MLKRLAMIGTMALALAAFAEPAHAAAHVGINIGIGVPVGPVVVARAPVYAPPPPPPGYVWQPAHYIRTAYGPRWVPGAWVPAPYAAPYYAPAPVVVAPRPAVGFGIRIGGRRW